MLQKKPLSLAVRAALGLTTVVFALPGLAQDRPSTADAFGLEEVVVTGSRIQKANLVTSSPVTQLDAEQLTLTGVTRIEDVLQAMPQVYLDQDSGQSIESDGTATLQLRNLGNSRTLVLLDGKRLPIASPTASESGADLNFIPMALVKRVEILTGGASSTYGSDAVAGVVNFLMIDDFEGVKLDYQFSRNRHDNSGNITSEKSALRGFPVPEGSVSDGDISDMTFIMGGNLNEGRGNVTAYATYRDIEAVTQSERDYSACALAGGLSRCGGSGTSGPGTFYFDSDGFSQNYYTDGNQFVPGRVLFNFAPPSYFQRPDERYTLGAMAHYELNEHADAYTQLMFMDDRTVAQFAPAGMFFDGGVSINCDNPLLSAQQYATMGCTGPDDDIGIYLGRRNVEGGPRFGDLRHTTYRGVFGLRGDITEGWRYDASFQYAEVDMRNTNSNYTDVAKMTDALNAVQSGGQVVCESGNPGCVPWNVFQTGGVTPDQTAYFSQRYFERGTTDQTVFSAYVQGSLAQYGLKLPWAENGVDVVVGTEWREENLDYLPDDASQRGDVGGLTAALVPVTGGYEVLDWFAEASVPLVEGKDFMQALNLEVGYRYSDYDTDVTSDTYKYALSWSVDDQVKLRGSFARAVRAANIVDMFQPQSGTLYSMTDDPCADVGANGLSGRGYTFEQCARSGVSQAQWNAGGPSSSPAAQYNTLIGGSTDLDPEESDTWSAGIILTPNFIDGLTVSIDWYDIDVQGAISTISPETTLLLCIENNQGCEKVNRGVADSLWLGNASATNGISQLSENIGYFRVKGIDVDAAYTVDLTSGWGSLNFSNILGYIDSWEQEEYEGAGAEECQGTYGGSCETPLAELRNRFTTTWATPWNVSLNLTWRFIDEIEQVQSSTPVDIDAYNYFDLAGTWNVTDYATVRLGVNNLMDEEPPITDNGATARNNGNTYPGVYDHLGQYWFLGGSLQF